MKFHRKKIWSYHTFAGIFETFGEFASTKAVFFLISLDHPHFVDSTVTAAWNEVLQGSVFYYAISFFFKPDEAVGW